MQDLSEGIWIVPADFVRKGDMLKIGGEDKYEEVSSSGLYCGINDAGFEWEVLTIKPESEWDWETYPTYGWQRNDEYDGPEFIMPYDMTNQHLFFEGAIVEIVNHDEKLIHPSTLLPIRWWVAVYEVDRGYGGPEEGGWWFDSGELVRSFPCTDHEQAERMAKLAQHSWPNNGTSSSVVYRGGDFRVTVEKYQPKKSYPEMTPHYS